MWAHRIWCEASKVIHSRRAWLVVAASPVAAAALSVYYSHLQLIGPEGHQLAADVALGSARRGGVAQVAMSILGILVATSETASRTLGITLLCEPRRRVLIARKMAVVIGASILVSAISVGGAVMGGWGGIELFHPQVAAYLSALTLAGAAARVLPAVALSAVLLGLLWTSAGLLIDQAAGVLTAYLLYVLPGANAAVLGIPRLARWLPDGAAQGISSSPLMLSVRWNSSGVFPLAAPTAALYLALLAFGAIALALLFGLQRDVT
jgi:hypothetical protein